MLNMSRIPLIGHSASGSLLAQFAEKGLDFKDCFLVGQQLIQHLIYACKTCPSSKYSKDYEREAMAAMDVCMGKTERNRENI